ncbi:hypothetical protein DM02DRAFT_562703 [Periconia macrospinosa]|uniref:Zn(2)-C6 fungal-type domain-containing protein n=1 Tax=Periconia macrospinosa TaxID=97972 RepID=A0A2V1DR77_9PLEO|nr:hypothetical protein DM02DRAFT_562703 [Periconia macrospinosa]
MPPKEKSQRTRRTVKACVICHKKKVRCDIDEIEGSVCTPCARDGYDCVPRERKRKRFTLSPSPPIRQRATSHTETSNLPEGNQATLNNPLGANRCDRGGSDGGTRQFRDPGWKSESEPDRHVSTRTSLTDRSPTLDRVHDPGYQAFSNNNPNSATTSTYTSSSNVVSYLGRLEYLRNDVPVNDDAGLPNKVPRRLSDTDLEILKLQDVDDLPPNAVRESLMNAFWTRCYPWTPVVERSWIMDRSPDTISLLLQHAILLAGSRVSPAHPVYTPEHFYKKARVLFWMGVEEDPIITIAATLLMHWFNPEGPERVSLDTSSFWLRVCVGLAYQVGLHREPTGRPDTGLRKRIWWSLVVRDCLINAGHGRPRAIDLKLADVSPTSVADFEGAHAPAGLFAAYVDISCILGDLTQSYLRKQGLQEHKKSLEDRLFRWLKTLPPHLQLCKSMEGRPPIPYNFETRQLHAQYFTVLVILNRPTDPKFSPSAASLLASSYIAGIYEDFMARDELKYLGPIFTFYCFAAGMSQLSSYRYTRLGPVAEKDLSVISKALEDLSKRWPTAVGSIKHLMDVRDKVTQRPSLGAFPETLNITPSTAQFFTDFGPELCRMWSPIQAQLAATQHTTGSNVRPPRELETAAGILHGLRTPAIPPVEMDGVDGGLQQQQAPASMGNGHGVGIEPTLLQPQEWFVPHGAGGLGNWLMIDWDQGFGW